MHQAFDSCADQLTRFYMTLLRHEHHPQEEQEFISAPVFTMHSAETVTTPAPADRRNPAPRYSLLAGITEALQVDIASEHPNPKIDLDPRIFFDVTAPSSTFICGS